MLRALCLGSLDAQEHAQDRSDEALDSYTQTGCEVLKFEKIKINRLRS